MAKQPGACRLDSPWHHRVAACAAQRLAGGARASCANYSACSQHAAVYPRAPDHSRAAPFDAI
eukprot:5184232-Pyramimonas_sp.AAC.1